MFRRRDNEGRRTFCSITCKTESRRVRSFCKKYGIPFLTPKNDEQMLLYEANRAIRSPWVTGDVNVVDPDLREGIKFWRVKGLTQQEIGWHLHVSQETVRSILEDEI